MSPAIDHVAWAVRDLGAAVTLFSSGLGGELVAGGDEPGTNVRSAHIRYPGGGKVELLSPLGPGAVATFLDRRGEGVHHVTFVHSGIGALASSLADEGYRVVDTDLDGKAWQETYVSPKSAHGCLVQVVDGMSHYGAGVPGLTLAGVLAGEWEWRDGVPVRR